MIRTIKKVKVLPFALISTIYLTIISIILLILMSIIGISFNIEELNGMGFFGSILAIIFYAVFGFISGTITALIYNFAAKVTGGIKFELTD